MAARIYIGSSSWADQSLVKSGRFYPPELKDTTSRLGFYAQHFNLAEIDSTYYALPSRKNMERWGESVPDGFKFNVKAFALFTQHPTRLSSIPKSFHEELPSEVSKKARVYYKDIPPEVTDQLWTIFSRAVARLREAGRLGAVLIDFPPWFVPSEANRTFFGVVREHLADVRVMIEFRNRLWVEDKETASSTFNLLREMDFGFVCVDEPPGLKTSFPPEVAITSAIGAVRFRGRNAGLWEAKGVSAEDRLDWWYTDTELAEWLPRINELEKQTDELYLSFSTKSGAQGVENAQRLQRLLALG